MSLWMIIDAEGMPVGLYGGDVSVCILMAERSHPERPGPFTASRATVQTEDGPVDTETITYTNLEHLVEAETETITYKPNLEKLAELQENLLEQIAEFKKSLDNATCKHDRKKEWHKMSDGKRWKGKKKKLEQY